LPPSSDEGRRRSSLPPSFPPFSAFADQLHVSAQLRLKHGDTFIEEKDPVLEKALSEGAPLTEKKNEVKPST
jgi:hypothetical protein